MLLKNIAKLKHKETCGLIVDDGFLDFIPILRVKVLTLLDVVKI